MTAGWQLEPASAGPALLSTPIASWPRWLARLARWWRGLRSDRGAHRRTRRDDLTGTAYGAPWAPAERPASISPSMLPGEDSWLHLQLVRLYLWVDLMQLEQEHWSAA